MGDPLGAFSKWADKYKGKFDQVETMCERRPWLATRVTGANNKLGLLFNRQSSIVNRQLKLHPHIRTMFRAIALTCSAGRRMSFNSELLALSEWLVAMALVAPLVELE
jgi:hypothetical protein